MTKSTESLAGRPITWVVAALALALVPQLPALPPALVPVLLMAPAWRLVAELRGWKPMNRYLRLLVTLATLALLLASEGSLFGRRAAVSLLAAMLSLKLLETYRVRDARIVASLSLFLCSTQFLFNQDLIMLFYAAGCVLLAMVAFTLLARQEAFAGTGRRPPRAARVASELGFGARLLALSVPVALALFLFFPRWSSPLWGIPEQALDSRTGLSDSMTPGSIQELFMDDSPAFRVTFHTPTPSQAELYWRGPVLWDFDGRTWQAGFYGRNVTAGDRPREDGAPHRYTVQLEPHERKSLFALDYPALLPDKTRLTLDFQLLRLRPVTELMTYDMASDPAFVDAPRLPDTLREVALRLPPDSNPRTRELIANWRQDTVGDAELVRRALAHFNREPFRYTLNPPLLSRHSVDEFLFDTREGFCEHYASAFAVMMRMAGIPARVVTGYQGGWHNTVGGYLLVRQSDAHAWAEVWLPGAGWTRIDPTAAVAPSRVESGALDALAGRRYLFDYQWLREVRNGLDGVGRLWNDWVIAFDASRQAGFLARLGWAHLGASALVVLLVAGLLLAILLVAPWLLRWQMRRAERPAERAWRRFRTRLRRAGVETRASMGPMEVAAAAAVVLPDQANEIGIIADRYRRLRYAPNASDARGFLSAVRNFRAKPAKAGAFGVRGHLDRN